VLKRPHSGSLVNGGPVSNHRQQEEAAESRPQRSQIGCHLGAISDALYTERQQSGHLCCGSVLENEGNMAIYDKPVRVLMREMISALAPIPGKQFSRESAIEWFAKHYPKIKERTISAHLIRFSTNVPSQLHYGGKPDEDLLYQVDGSHFRLYESATDRAPIHSKADAVMSSQEIAEPIDGQASSEFAYESDLLAKNLSRIEPGLKLYQRHHWRRISGWRQIYRYSRFGR
jgi:hypothetical protein